MRRTTWLTVSLAAGPLERGSEAGSGSRTAGSASEEVPGLSATKPSNPRKRAAVGSRPFSIASPSGSATHRERDRAGDVQRATVACKTSSGAVAKFTPKRRHHTVTARKRSRSTSAGTA